MTYNRPEKLNYTKIAALICALVVSYFAVLEKLGRDWWTDENYSHGLLVPFVIAFIVWNEWDRIKRLAAPGPAIISAVMIATAAIMLLAGTLAAELFTQRISLLLMLAGIIVYLVGQRVLNILAVPFALLLLSIPIPQIVFNKVAFPLQIWASQTAVWWIRLFDVPTVRRGNVIDILPSGSTQTISLEVVEACSGIRSLMTLVTLALVLAYFTRRNQNGRYFGFERGDLIRALTLMVLAVPIAVLTNAARVTGTGFLTYHYGKQAVEGTWHDASGWLVYVTALLLLLGANYLLGKLFKNGNGRIDPPGPNSNRSSAAVWPLVICLAASGIAVQWFVNRGEIVPARAPLSGLSTNLEGWYQQGEEIRFDPAVEKILRTTDYTMREYTHDSGRVANLYIGYYESQRSGATYHSPQNCLPGAGWVMKEPQYVEVVSPAGRVFRARKYIVQNGIYNEVMIYWYQGRGRIEANEYTDKINTVWDSVTQRRSDGAMVRIMTSVWNDEQEAVNVATDLAGQLVDELSPYVPE